jgi:hypothetical protein
LPLPPSGVRSGIKTLKAIHVPSRNAAVRSGWGAGQREELRPGSRVGA